MDERRIGLGNFGIYFLPYSGSVSVDFLGFRISVPIFWEISSRFQATIRTATMPKMIIIHSIVPNLESPSQKNGASDFIILTGWPKD